STHPHLHSFPTRRSSDLWGHRGLALSTACVATTNFLILYALMRSHLGRLESRAMLALLSKLALASAVLLLASWAGAHFLLADWEIGGHTSELQSQSNLVC